MNRWKREVARNLGLSRRVFTWVRTAQAAARLRHAQPLERKQLAATGVVPTWRISKAEFLERVNGRLAASFTDEEWQEVVVFSRRRDKEIMAP